MTTPERLQGYLTQYAEKYPGAWKGFDYLRSGRGTDLPDWPEWCWCPLAAAYAIASVKDPRHPTGPDPQVSVDVGPLGALAAWRMTRGIYRYDSDLFRALWQTPIEGNLPIDVLYRLPEWCVYIEVPAGMQCPWYNFNVHGWFAHLEWDVNVSRPELRFVFDTPDGLISFPVHLHAGTLRECVASAIEVSVNNMELCGLDAKPLIRKRDFTEQIAPFISVTLYLCAEEPDIVDLRGKRERPSNPQPVKTKKGLRTFPADNHTSWQVGYRIGAALRRAYHVTEPASAEAETVSETRERSSPRPHIRRAHWHSYWTGPRKGKREAILKWLPPIPVGAGELVPTIHLVEKEKTPTK
jgi:hypothetical protein